MASRLRAISLEIGNPVSAKLDGGSQHLTKRPGPEPVEQGKPPIDTARER